MSKPLKERTVKAIKPPSTGHQITYDSELKGFGLRTTKSGVKSFVLNYRISGRERRITIGRYPEWSATAARKRAQELRRQIDIGQDPMEARHTERSAPTMNDLCDLYCERHLPKKAPSSQRNDLSLIKHAIRPRLGKSKIYAVRHSDIEALHRELSSETPFRANRVVSLLSKMFNLAIRWDLREDNPARGIEKNTENKRDRYLSIEELERLSNALSQHGSKNAANAIRLLLLTGARRGEVLQARWSEFDLKVGAWTKPSSHTKQRKLHRVPISKAAIALLKNMKSTVDSDFLFPGKDRNHPLTDLKKSWSRVRAAAGLNDLRIHDLRHTYASLLASSGASLPTIGALLGHTQPQTTARYAHLLDDPLRMATEQAAAFIDDAKGTTK